MSFRQLASAVFFIAQIGNGQKAPVQDPAALALLQQVRSTMALPNATSPLFRLEATLHTFDEKGKPSSDGTVVEESIRGGTSKRTMTLGDQTSTDYFMPDGKVFHEGTDHLSFWPEKASALLFAPVPASPEYLKNLDVKSQPFTVGGSTLQCIVLLPTASNGRTQGFYLQEAYCFSSQPIVVRTIDDSNQLHTTFNRILKFGDSYVPGDIAVAINGKLRVSLHVDNLRSANDLTESNLAPAVTATERKRLSLQAGANAGHKIAGSVPVYPEFAKINHQQGSVVMFGLIGKDGAVSQLEVVASPSQVLSDSAVAAVRTWRYTPYLVAGEPVEVSTEITVNYSFGR